jgi:guanylate kinase
MVAQGDFLEHETVFDYHYGTPKQWVEEQLALGNDVILEIDWQGARDVRALLPEKVVTIFILPPAISTLEQRLRKREQDDETAIQRRMQDALEEISHYAEFDYLVINDDFERTVAELRKIIEYRRRGQDYRGPDLQQFAKQLMTAGSNIK